jgi:hypothetical protein
LVVLNGRAILDPGGRRLDRFDAAAVQGSADRMSVAVPGGVCALVTFTKPFTTAEVE